MSEKKTFYVTTAIDYVNAAPHLGHAYEKVATDVLARFHRMRGEPVFFLTGTDEHGTKVEKTARSKGMNPKEYTDQVSQSFREAWAHLNLDYNRFIRTTDPDHYEVVEFLWRKLKANDDIYKASYTGYYCAGCENFVTERDLTPDGNCPNHQAKPEMVQEENYFFRLTKYKDAIRRHILTNRRFIRPEFRAAEVLNMLDNIEDISVSRSKNSVSWGIPVPDDPEQVIYVWIDALSNYLTGIGYHLDEKKFKQCWPADFHIIGKDILRFHAIYWPAMLMAAGIELPRCIYAHGFINLNDSKISKSLGNVISPAMLSEKFNLPNSDPIRYYLMTVASFGHDGNFTDDDFKLKVNVDLANNVGNLLNRTLNMANKYFEGRVPEPKDAPQLEAFKPKEEVSEKVARAYEELQFQQAAEYILERVDDANKLINDSEPWTLFKENKLDELSGVIYAVLDTLRRISLMLAPITPVMSAEMWKQLGCTSDFEKTTWQDILKSPLPAGQVLALAGPILPRLESELAGATKKQ